MGARRRPRSLKYEGNCDHHRSSQTEDSMLTTVVQPEIAEVVSVMMSFHLIELLESHDRIIVLGKNLTAHKKAKDCYTRLSRNLGIRLDAAKRAWPAGGLGEARNARQSESSKFPSETGPPKSYPRRPRPKPTFDLR
ncbi:hypothetical protein EVAR_62756_1 [Eumeta japonica]|uniref:Uncharacterized protein n=1 Tax=Eumeta variegata TaxID=151549 RepID=A0A4C1Z998_EUMVA|nr:hypothetical protein EVAR_62756_1 [Eumeta japonica]